MNFFISNTALVVTEIATDDIERLVRMEIAILRRVGSLIVGPRTSVQVYEFKSGWRTEVENVLAGFCFTATAEYSRQACNGSCDIALARRQVGPDGLVPGNARECAEMWEAEAVRLRADLERVTAERDADEADHKRQLHGVCNERDDFCAERDAARRELATLTASKARTVTRAEIEPCDVHPFSSRACERWTRSCVTVHERASPGVTLIGERPLTEDERFTLRWARKAIETYWGHSPDSDALLPCEEADRVTATLDRLLASSPTTPPPLTVSRALDPGLTVWHAIKQPGVRRGDEWIRWEVPSDEGPSVMFIRRDTGAGMWLCEWESDITETHEWDEFHFDDDAVDAPCTVVPALWRVTQCPRCGGRRGIGVETGWVECPDCAGLGYLVDAPAIPAETP